MRIADEDVVVEVRRQISHAMRNEVRPPTPDVERAERIVRQYSESVELPVLAVLALTVDAPRGCANSGFRSGRFVIHGSSHAFVSKTTQTVWKRSGEGHLTVSDPPRAVPFSGAA